MKYVIVLALASLIFMGCIAKPSSSINIPPADEAIGKVGIMPLLMIGGVVVGIFALLNGSKLGYAAVIACLAGLALSLAVVKYATILAIGGLVGSLGTLVISLFKKQVGIVLTKVEKLR